MNPPNIEAAHIDLPIDVNPPTTEEIKIRQTKTKNEKAAGPDNIPAEALKSDIEATTSMLYLLFKKIWKEEQVPMDWKEGHLGRIPTIEEYMELKTTLNQYQNENLQCERQDSQFYCMELKLGELQQPQSRKYKYL
ncbi:unnamed protein product [Schistosoma curassoni]|uniref:Reverse transcriptase domain-containing protein n=1 Tax=Schistosoma curassoni TaxID=6186 RepID=A0A183KXP4_9TREM|nr:unnamed protein product [Schistosoma curassoni]